MLFCLLYVLRLIEQRPVMSCHRLLMINALVTRLGTATTRFYERVLRQPKSPLYARDFSRLHHPLVAG